LNVNAQARLNYTESAIRNDFPNQTFEVGRTTSGVKYISTFFDTTLVAYYFDENGYSYLVQIVPANVGVLNGLVENYNNTYVIISATEWRAYTEGGIMQIELVFNDNNTQSIYFSIIK